MPNRTRLKALTPLLTVSDLQRAVDFYCGKLGFVDPAVYGEPPCFAMMNRDGFDLMLSLAGQPEQMRPHGPHGVWDLYLHVADVEAEMAALGAAGVAIDKGPADTFYQMREIECVDPDGHRICLAQDIGDDPFRVAEVWDGVLDVGQQRLRLVLHVAPSGDGLVARLDSPDQGARGLAVDSIVRDAAGIRFEMKAIGAAYEGTFTEDVREVAGVWLQGGRRWPLVLRRQ